MNVKAENTINCSDAVTLPSKLSAWQVYNPPSAFVMLVNVRDPSSVTTLPDGRAPRALDHVIRGRGLPVVLQVQVTFLPSSVIVRVGLVTNCGATEKKNSM